MKDAGDSNHNNKTQTLQFDEIPESIDSVNCLKKREYNRWPRMETIEKSYKHEMADSDKETSKFRYTSVYGRSTNRIKEG